MCSALSFIGEHPWLCLSALFIVVVGLCASWDNYLDRTYGEDR